MDSKKRQQLREESAKEKLQKAAKNKPLKLYWDALLEGLLWSNHWFAETTTNATSANKLTLPLKETQNHSTSKCSSKQPDRREHRRREECRSSEKSRTERTKEEHKRNEEKRRK